MKYTLILLLSVTCTKTVDEPKANCYTCEIAAFNGQPGYKRDVCTERIDTVVFKNPQGQTLTSQCIPK